MHIMHIQIKHREIHEEKCFKYENGCVMDDSDDGNEQKKELCVKKDAEIIVSTGGPRHKPDNREECRAGKNVMDPIMFGDVYNTEYPYKKDNNRHQ